VCVCVYLCVCVCVCGVVWVCVCVCVDPDRSHFFLNCELKKRSHIYTLSDYRLAGY
jgi:hypothetical protein